MYRIAVIPGDGTGPEVVAEGLKVLEAAASSTGFSYDTTTFDFGGDRYLAKGETLPEGAVDELKSFDAIFLGAIGHPDVSPGILEQGILLEIRFALDQYINLRPVKLYPGVECPLRDKGPEQVDLVVVRENTEGLYVGSGGFIRKGTKDEIAIQESVNTRMGVERCIRYAFEYCRARDKDRKLTLCGKTNVLTFAHDLWERVMGEVAGEYPDIETDYAHVDAICMWFVKNPEWFDVVVTDNMFGDIITDLGAIIQGGMGIAAGGNINPEGTSMFEPIGGSAPKYTGKNVINPLAAISAVQMMLDFLGEKEAARRIEGAVIEVLHTGRVKSLSAGRMGMGTAEVGDLVAGFVSKGVPAVQ
ncbi:MAG: 3-isopropylmalate dehydrogenase [Actinobacteria bacterium]|nr:3-isopropylmalate dehydrogenase [Actinomycetota bacterium]MBU4302236.1 3-isopropylmalate dehydrogenase [Actinomycetota bacterium]MBU4385733.1 3-isopropylmalate dehydrogenase [Actinomycetota bacterium]MBU4489909.1 3-isopropylmalate dehydrogenase [Actinomycetota bacterium]MCG2795507.1 3-isopropylmalate dehydrogenase [Actinomycetes bacterium]